MGGWQLNVKCSNGVFDHIHNFPKGLQTLHSKIKIYFFNILWGFIFPFAFTVFLVQKLQRAKIIRKKWSTQTIVLSDCCWLNQERHFPRHFFPVFSQVSLKTAEVKEYVRNKISIITEYVGMCMMMTWLTWNYATTASKPRSPACCKEIIIRYD